MIYFTSDNHFGHTNVIHFCSRPFQNVQDMEEGMVKRWNAVVKPEDTVYVVGDFAFTNATERTRILERLNGFKVLVQGNHDKAKDTPKGFVAMVQEVTLFISGQAVSVKHYPLSYGGWRRLWAKFSRRKKPRYLERYPRDVGQFHIHGHTHSTEKFRGRQIHVGVDAWNYTPVPLWEIKKFIDTELQKGKGNGLQKDKP